MGRGRPKINKVPFSTKRLQEALDYCQVSLRELNNDQILQASERTIRRAKQEGRINKDILDRLGKRLNVDPLYLEGEFDRLAEITRQYANDEELINQTLSVRFHPYIDKIKRETAAFSYVDLLLDEKGIPRSELKEMDSESQKMFYVEIDLEVSKIVRKYFGPQLYSGHEYSIPMPAEDEIYHAKQ